MVTLEGLEDLLEGRFPLAPGHVGTALAVCGRFAVFEVEAGDAACVFFDERNRGFAVDAEVVADVEVESSVRRGVEDFVEAGRAALAVGVEGDVELAFGSELSDAGEVGIVGGNLHGDVIGPEGFSDVPDVFVFGVGHGGSGREFEGVDVDARVVVHFAEFFELVHGGGLTPLRDFGGGFAAGVHLIGSGAALGQGWRAGEGLGGVAHEFDGADVAIEAVLEGFFGTAGESAEAIGDGSDLNALEARVGLCRGGESGGCGELSEGAAGEQHGAIVARWYFSWNRKLTGWLGVGRVESEPVFNLEGVHA